MKNDPIINAPISKIVEAIMKADCIREIDENSLQIFENNLRTALASLESSEREVLSGEQFYEKFREVRNELSAITGTHSLSEAIIKTFNRYLAEKGGEG